MPDLPILCNYGKTRMHDHFVFPRVHHATEKAEAISAQNLEERFEA